MKKVILVIFQALATVINFWIISKEPSIIVMTATVGIVTMASTLTTQGFMMLTNMSQRKGVTIPNGFLCSEKMFSTIMGTVALLVLSVMTGVMLGKMPEVFAKFELVAATALPMILISVQAVTTHKVDERKTLKEIINS